MNYVTIDLSRLRNPEYLQYMQDYLQLLSSNDPALLRITPEFGLLTTKTNQIEAILKQDTGSAITPIIEALDLERDSYLVGIFTAINGLCNHFDPAKKAAAISLKDRLNVYGTATEIAKQSLQGETATIKNLVIDLQTIPTYSTALTTLALADWVAQLKVVNDAFNVKYLQRTEEIGGLNPDKIKELRLEANALYYQLRNVLMAQALVAAYTAPFPKAINDVNALTEQYNNTLAQRVGLAGGDEPPVIPPDPDVF